MHAMPSAASSSGVTGTCGVVAPARDPVQRGFDDHRGIRHECRAYAPAVHKVMVAIWRPDPSLHRLVGDDVVVRFALEDQGRYAAGSPFDVLLAATVEDPSALELQGLGERVWGFTVDERRPRVGAALSEITLVALMRRKPELTHDEFVDHWTQRHTPLALAHHAGLYDYTQNVVTDRLTAAADEIDGIAELGFGTRADFDTKFYDSDDGRRVIGEDVRRFLAGPGPDTTLLAPPRYPFWRHLRADTHVHDAKTGAERERRESRLPRMTCIRIDPRQPGAPPGGSRHPRRRGAVLRRPGRRGLLHVVFVRSTIAHAEVLAVDTTEAVGLPGVVAVYTADDLDLAPDPGLRHAAADVQPRRFANEPGPLRRRHRRRGRRRDAGAGGRRGRAGDRRLRPAAGGRRPGGGARRTARRCSSPSTARTSRSSSTSARIPPSSTTPTSS